MNDALPGLDQLRELPLPAPVSYWPQTWGWAVLAALLLAGGGWAALAGWRRHRRNRYRRQGLAALAQLAREAARDRLAARGLPALLKRVALAARPAAARADVASLGGQAWLVYLARTAPPGMPPESAQMLRLLAYAPDEAVRQLDDAALAQLIQACRAWVVNHHVAS
ncbi:DUF4381 domain-containing protein [Achromobacter sp. UMC71]|uniref:DUF4381 domain-containing protein n=1 Tax=Achromobacter sp. UMC71 TaxID=1862320 RepID=UPI001602CA6B|nr:DUF4381 domain-containing protein [Achromobacter sp. UMC71]MBB1627288.1 alpha-2 type XI collagen [Achromobacter sp. UMC71]